jgi:hypothetical protein
MRPARARTVNRALVALALGGLLAAGATGIARADGELDPVEVAYVQAYGASAVCPTIDAYPSEAGVTGVWQAIVEDGFYPDSAVDIINASVAVYCPRHWGLLVRIGQQARGERYIA